MGMAASQARLLSITSRLSDNELRSQLINNAKMRLTTESSQVSDEYIKALNETQYMFTNYDADNKASYQQLTFNSLTAYNEFNNQYGIANTAGQIFVSEKDAQKYESSGRNLEKFLSMYGLEYKTTYFEKLAAANSGNIKLDTIKEPGGTTITNYSPFDAATIQKMYEGDQATGGAHAGYDNSLMTKSFNEYLTKAETFSSAKADYYNSMKNVILEYANGVSYNGITFKAINEYLREDSSSNATKYFDAFKGIIDKMNSDGKFSDNADYDGQTFYNYMKSLIADVEYGGSNRDTKTSTTTAEYSTDANGNSVLTIPYAAGEILKITIDKTSGEASAKIYEDIGDGTYAEPTDDKGNPIGGYTAAFDDATSTFVLTFDNQNSYTFYDLKKWTGTPSGTKDLTYKETLYGDYKNDVYFANLDILVNYFNANMLSAFDISKFNNTAASSAQYKEKYNNYVNAGQALSQFIFGKDIGFSNYANLDDYKWVYDQDCNGNYKMSAEYKPVLDVLAVEDVMDVYGEPKYAYFKDDDPDSNADAEAEWYTNLFNRMKNGGYKVLENGLASSAEWMRYALESGLAKLEQVDNNQNWNSITYTSCSDITEQTNDLAITVAEAKYNKAMNKIENKDKAYDAELKNIDTEHTALQTEYDSIKSALDKNVERNFKLYS